MISYDAIKSGEVAVPAAEDHGLSLDAIQIDGGTQSRATLNQHVVDDYAEAIKAGAAFPPIVVFYDGKKHWLADGFHRFHAYQKAGRTKVAADIRQGTRRDAILHSVGANETHGLRRTRDDKRRAVLTLLNDAEWGKWTDREIARRCAVSPQTVANVRADTVQNGQSDERTYVHPKTGKPTTMKTAGINAGRNQFQAKASEDNGSITGGAGAVAGEASRLASGRTDAGEAATVGLPTNLEAIIEAAWKHGYLIGFTSSGEGYNGEYPFGDDDDAPDSDPQWAEGRDLAFAANRDALAQISPSASNPAVTVADKPQAPRPSATVPHSVTPPPPGEADKADDADALPPVSSAAPFQNPRCREPETCD